MFQSSGAHVSKSKCLHRTRRRKARGKERCWLRTGSSVPAVRPSTREPSVSYSFAESDLSSLPAMGCVVQASDAKPDDELLELPLVDSIFTLEDFACAPSRPLPRSSTSAQTSRGTAKGGRGRGGSKVHEAVGPPGALPLQFRVQASSLWNSFHRWICESCAGSFKAFFHTTFLKQASEAKIPHAPEALWPLPTPFWKLAVGDDNGVADSHLKRGINVLVIMLNWLQLSSKAA